MYLVEFVHEYYCQGYEQTTTTVLVKASSFSDACRKILDRPLEFRNAKNFINRTID